MNEIVKKPLNSESPSWRSWVSRLVASIRATLWLLKPEYPRWKHLIPENPTLEQAREAWKIITKWYYPEECTILGIHKDEWNEWINFTTPNGRTVSHWWFWEHTDSPTIKWDFFYSWAWCPWSVDERWLRFYLIDKNTWLPRDWEGVQAIEIFRNYVLNVAKWDMQRLFIWSDDKVKNS